VTALPAPEPFIYEPPCAACGRAATHVELRREGDAWWFVYEGLVAGNGLGHRQSDAKAALLTAAFADPPHFDLMQAADLHYDNAGFCVACGLPYCVKHWNVSVSGYGRCPKGHGKSLDPHWSPD
jgi:hypothetical protein